MDLDWTHLGARSKFEDEDKGRCLAYHAQPRLQDISQIKALPLGVLANLPSATQLTRVPEEILTDKLAKQNGVSLENR